MRYWPCKVNEKIVWLLGKPRTAFLQAQTQTPMVSLVYANDEGFTIFSYHMSRNL
eukprot:m.157759 g.157759  ORF g.157759 m.157759 type:complete len:55 (-) comp15122_c0_seq18:14-178(-)